MLTERDLSLLEFLWKWKGVSTAALTARFFENRAPETAYTRLWHLRRSGYITFVATGDAEAFVWSLTQRGFHAIRDRLPDLGEEGFKSESVGHDSLVSAIHLGDWLIIPPPGSETFSEQEIRRFHLDCFPDWCPKTKRHRPDGYWRVLRKDKWLTIALEVEIHQKKSSYYSWLAKFYDDHQNVDRVVWVVRPRRLAESIWRELKKTVGDRVAIHNFLALEDVQKLGWQAPILIGPEQGKSLAFLLNPRPQTLPNPDWTRFLLDTRKSPHKSIRYRKLKSSGSGNCIGHIPIEESHGRFKSVAHHPRDGSTSEGAG